MAYPEFELIPDLTESEFAIDPTQLTLDSGGNFWLYVLYQLTLIWMYVALEYKFFLRRYCKAGV